MIGGEVKAESLQRAGEKLWKRGLNTDLATFRVRHVSEGELKAVEMGGHEQGFLLRDAQVEAEEGVQRLQEKRSLLYNEIAIIYSG